MKGDLAEEITKGGKTFTRRLNPDRTYTAPDGGTLTLPGRSLMLVRNVGHLMTNPAILDRDGNEVPEGIMDADDHRADRAARRRAERPPRQFPRRLDLYRQAEDARPGGGRLRRRDLRPRRGGARHGARTPSRSASWTRSGAPPSTSRNASAPPRERVVFINTGFLDRTGDEIHTSMEAGPMIRKGDMKQAAVDLRLRGLERRHRARMRARRPRPDRQGHVGDARPDGGDAGAEDRPSQGRRQHRLGAVADRRDAARHALPQGRRPRRAGRR